MMDPLKIRKIEVTNLKDNKADLEGFVSGLEGLYSITPGENSVQLTYNLLGTSLRDIVGEMKKIGYDIPDSKNLGILYSAEDAERLYANSSFGCSACGGGCGDL